jgi:NHL repeat
VTKARIVAVSALLVLGCDSVGSERRPARLDLVLQQVDTLISTESGLLAHPTDIAVGSDGEIYVADARNNQVLVLTTGGEPAETIGRQGQGPGEFSRPSAVAPSEAGLFVFDGGNARVQHLSNDHEFLSSTPTPPQTLAAPVFLNRDGSLLVSSMGADSSLALSFDPSGTLLRRFGSPIVPPPAVFDFGSMKERISQGEVPAEFRNDVLTAQAPDGGSWLALQTEAEIRRYDRLGALLWRVSIDDPQSVRARERFFERNAEAQEGMVAPLRLFSDISVADDDLWVLLAGRDDDPAIILTFDTSGLETRRLSIPAALGARSMIFDPVRSRLLIGTADDAQLISVQIEG